MAKSTPRNGKIDFLRFIFSICVVLNHAKVILTPKTAANLFRGYSFAVEFFFLVSGYLLMASVERAEKSSRLPLSKETGAFLLKKYKSLYPEAAVAYFASFIITCLATKVSPVALFQESWPELFLLTSTGIYGTYVVPVVWYVSSMILCMALLYPLVRKYKDWAICVVLPVAALLVLGYLYRNYETVRDPLKWTGFTVKGNLRAFAELSLGMLCYCVTKKLKNINFSVFGRILLSVAEIAFYGLFIWYMATEVNGMKDFFYLLLLCIAVVISFSQKSLGQRLFNNRVCTFLGKYSLAIYFGHYVIATQLSTLLPAFGALGWKRQLAAYLAVSLLVGLVIMLISDVIRKVGPYAAKGVKALMTRRNTAES